MGNPSNPTDGDLNREVHPDGKIVYTKFIESGTESNRPTRSGWYFHREDGPAVEGFNKQGIKYSNYYIDGYHYSEQEFLTRTSKLGKILYG